MEESRNDVPSQHEWHDALMDEYGLEMTKLAYTYVKSWPTAQDVVQDVFVKVYHQYERREALYSMKAWLIRLTINQSKDYLKSSWFRRVIRLESLQIEKTTKSAALDMEQQQFNEQLSQAVLALKQEYREVIFLFYYEELTVPEISEILNVKEPTLHSRLRRAKSVLQEQLKGCLLYTSPSPRDQRGSRMPSSA